MTHSLLIAVRTIPITVLSGSWSANLGRRASACSIVCLTAKPIPCAYPSSPAGTNEVSASAHREVVELLQEKSEQERILREGRAELDTEITRLRSEVDAAHAERDRQTKQSIAAASRIDGLEEEVQTFRDQVASEASARRSLEQRHSDSLAEGFEQAKLLEAALADGTEKTRDAERLTVELAAAKDEIAQVRRLHQESDSRISALLAEQADTLRRVEDARKQGSNLEEQVRLARDEGQQAAAQLSRAAAENERLLKIQAAEADRLLRDHIAEADGDRAVLEHQFSELKAELGRKSRALEDLKVELTSLKVDQSRADGELLSSSRSRNDAKRELQELRRSLEHAQTNVAESTRQRLALETSFKDLLIFATRIRDANLKAMATAQKYVSPPRPSANGLGGQGTPSAAGDESISASMLMSTPSVSSMYSQAGPSTFPTPSSFPPSATIVPRSPRMGDMPFVPVNGSPLNNIKPDEALVSLSAFDLDAFTEVINRTGSTIRKWQKQTKEYRERARSKITYRNFAKGDLALFLPTRNSANKSWAAFNGTSPIEHPLSRLTS